VLSPFNGLKEAKWDRSRK